MRRIKRLTLFVPGLALLLVLSLAGCAGTSAIDNRQPIKVVSVLDTTTLVNGEINPGGPTIKITLENISSESVVSLNVTMDEGGPRVFPFDFNVTPSNPLRHNRTISSERRLIGGGFGGGIPYSLSINGALQSGAVFNYTWEPMENKGAQ